MLCWTCHFATFHSKRGAALPYSPQPGPCWHAQGKSLQTAGVFQINGSSQQSSTAAAEAVRNGPASNRAAGSEGSWPPTGGEGVTASAGGETWAEPSTPSGKRFPGGAAAAAPSLMLALYLQHWLPAHNLPNCELQFFSPQHYGNGLEHRDVWKGTIWHQEPKKQIQMTS